jgi:RNA polymerase sigma-70 factor (ECF subfamily)
MQDNEIISLFFNRDETAITEVDNKYHRYLFKVAYNLLFDKQDCEECLNDSYLGCWNTIPPTTPKSLKFFVAKIVRRRSIDILKMKTRDKRIPKEMKISLEELGDCIVEQASVIDMETQQLSEVISSYLWTVSDLDRLIFVRKYWYLDSIKVIAKKCDLTESNVKTKLFRIRKELKLYLMKEGVYIGR